jgi:hypothetical protein
VRPVSAQRLVVAIQPLANRRGNRFLADAQMHGTAHLLFCIMRSDAFFNQSDAQHRPVKPASQFFLHVISIKRCGQAIRTRRAADCTPRREGMSTSVPASEGAKNLPPRLASFATTARSPRAAKTQLDLAAADA